MAKNWTNSLLILLILGLLPAAPLKAFDVKAVQQRYAGHNDFTVAFSQKTFQVLAGREITFTGKVAYKKPDRARMDVATPERQIITLKGTTVTVTLPDKGTQAVQEVPKEIASRNILAFIAGLANIDQDYTVRQDQDHLSLTPKKGTGTINIWVTSDNLVQRIQLQDALGNKSDIQLKTYAFDLGLKDDFFNPPAVKPKS